MKRNNSSSYQINITTAAHILLIFTILVLVQTITTAAIEKELQHKLLISKTEQFISRRKRNVNFSRNEYLNDYYANYYNDYYNNYYNRVTNVHNNAAPNRKSVGSFGNFDENLNVVSAHGTKYTYKPIIRYKSTHQKRKKLFVPV